LDLDKMKYLRNANADTEVECAEIGLPSSWDWEPLTIW
jgi:hypothetical protein